MGITARRLALVFGTALLAFGSVASPATKSYRYALDAEHGFYSFRGLLTSARAKGTHYDVEYDAAGRLHRTGVVHDGKTVSEEVFHYTGESKLADSYDEISVGERTGYVKLSYDGKGNLNRISYFTLHDVLTSYVVLLKKGNCVERTWYNADGSVKSQQVRCYNPDGILVHRKQNPEAGNAISSESDYDPETGHPALLKQYDGTELICSRKCIYDKEGELTRAEISRPDGSVYGTEEFVKGLLTQRTFTFATNNVVEFRYSYNLKDWVDQTKVFYNGKYVCLLTYQMLANASCVRTTAKSPEGEIWAEYQNNS